VVQRKVPLLFLSAPALSFDADAVAFGAATHDIGKARHLEELTVPGVRHEAAGFAPIGQST